MVFLLVRMALFFAGIAATALIFLVLWMMTIWIMTIRTEMPTTTLTRIWVEAPFAIYQHIRELCRRVVEGIQTSVVIQSIQEASSGIPSSRKKKKRNHHM